MSNFYVGKIDNSESNPSEETNAETLRVDFEDPYTYKGQAPAGSLDEDPVWRISRIFEDSVNDGDITILWADGDTYYDNVWDDRAELDYS